MTMKLIVFGILVLVNVLDPTDVHRDMPINSVSNLYHRFDARAA